MKDSLAVKLYLSISQKIELVSNLLSGLEKCGIINDILLGAFGIFVFLYRARSHTANDHIQSKQKCKEHAEQT